MATSVSSAGEPRVRHSRAQDVDRYVGKRMRERRIRLGMTQQQLAELIGVTYQQAHKYEKGINRIASGRLYTIGQALGVEVGYFFEGFKGGSTFQTTTQQRMQLEMARNFVGVTKPKHRRALLALCRALNETDDMSE